jgi:23S rRNA (cytosine1962-C5)-methyltransferase
MFSVTVKKIREGVLRKKHPWLFSRALETLPSTIMPGDICQVVNSSGTVLGFAFVNPKTDLVCRMLSFARTFSVDTFIETRLAAAWQERKHLVPSSTSTAFRLVNAEGDGLPGLIVDCYGETAVMQISTMGMERCKDRVIASLQELGIKRLYEKSSSAARVLEGLSPKNEAWLVHDQTPATSDEVVEISEHGLRYQVAIEGGQKTGFFLDQREMRALLRQFAPGKSVLNCFAYSGGFSYNALKAGASRVVSIDSSSAACASMRVHGVLNNLSEESTNHQIITGDVPEFLRTTKDKFDIIILDPPAYVKKAKDVKRGFAQYLELNRLGLDRLNPGGTLFTFSCSPFFGDEEWQAMLAAAMLASGKWLRIMAQHRHALDHPVALSHPEGRYIKGTVVKDFSL